MGERQLEPSPDRGKKGGKVYLVGGGPGDPGLLTLKGRDAIASSDVIIYDYLANPDLLVHAREKAERIFVGKREGGGKLLEQEEINRLLVRYGREGKVVTRLKGGDPFIFGRGGEEAEALADAGIPFEVVPGVSAALGVPAYAGIPLTHRDLASSVAFVTGREEIEKKESIIDWERLSTGNGTLVFFMGVLNLPKIVERLIAKGRNPSTPVAVVRWGTTPRQRTIVGTLADIASKAAGTRPPVLIIVGDVVSLREKLNWFERRPLFGKTILVTRAREQVGEFAALLSEAGARVIEFPTIEIVSLESYDDADAAARRVGQYDWILFTSQNGVRSFFERLFAVGRDLRDLKGLSICAIGPRTAQEVIRRGIRVDLIPEEFVAEGVIEGMERRGPLAGKRILIPRAREARELLPEELGKRGAKVEVVPVYRTVPSTAPVEPIRREIETKEIDVVTFTSSSTVRNFVERIGPDAGRLLKNVVVAAIGPITAGTAREFGIEPAILPEEYTIPALAEAIRRHFEGARR